MSEFKNCSLLVDTSHLAYRSFFALQNLPSEVVKTNLVFGVVNSLLSLVKKFNPQQLILAWDKGYKAKTALYAGYKRKTDIMSEEQRVEFREQFDALEDFLNCLGIKCCYQIGVEADDVIAFLCKELSVDRVDNTKESILTPIVIVSSDHDLHPLLQDNVAMWKPHKEELYTVDSFRNEFGLEPHQYTEVQALMGCSGDKVPGVRGIGPKFALELIKKYGNVQAIKDSTDTSRVIDLVKDNWPDVELAYKLVAFEDIKPTLYITTPNFGKVRKKLYMWELDNFIENWGEVEALSRL